MKKYLDLSNNSDIEEIEKNFQKYTQESEKLANELTANELKKINYYRKTPIQNIKNDIERKVNNESKKVRFILEASYEYIRKRDNLSMSIDVKKISDFFLEMDKRQLTKEQIVEARNMYIRDTIETLMQEAREKRILYKSMKEEEIEKYLKLYYQKELKFYLINAKKSAIEKSKNDLGKIGKFNDINSDLISKISHIEYQNSTDDIKKKAIKKEIRKNILYTLIAPEETAITEFIFSTFVGGSIAAGAGMGSHNFSVGLGSFAVGSALFYAITFALVRREEIKKFLMDMKVMKEAKELGLIEDMKNSYKAKDELQEYSEQLNDMYISKKSYIKRFS